MTCSVCGKVCLSSAGLGTHRWRAHGLAGIKREIGRTQVACEVCGAVVLRCNIHRHVRQMHGTKRVRTPVVRTPVVPIHLVIEPMFRDELLKAIKELQSWQ